MSYVIKPCIVADCVNRLRIRKIHPHFAGYLCIQRTAVHEGRTVNLQPKFKEFYQEFFVVESGSKDTPYIKPFIDESPSDKNRLFNKNVAGSYAASSLRGNNPLRQVIDVQGERALTMYSLKENHPQLALTHLLYSQQIQAADLAIFLYRNSALLLDKPTVYDVIDIFAYEFGHSSKPDEKPNEEFHVLYTRLWQ